MKRLSELSFEDICALPAGRSTDAMVARECMNLKVAEICSAVCSVDVKRPRVGREILDYAIHRPNYSHTVFEYEPIKPYSTKVEAVAEIMWIYGIMVYLEPGPVTGSDHNPIYKALIPISVDQYDDRPATRLDIIAPVWVEAETWPLAVVRAALVREKLQVDKELQERLGWTSPVEE